MSNNSDNPLKFKRKKIHWYDETYVVLRPRLWYKLFLIYQKITGGLKIGRNILSSN